MKTPDVFNNDKQYIVTNWSKEDFTTEWAKQAYTLKTGESRQFPEYLAFHITKHFVDREMTRDGKERLTGVEEARKEYEDKTMGEISEGMDSPAIQLLKEQLRKEIEGNKVDEDGDPRTENKKTRKKKVVEEVPENEETFDAII